MISVEVYPLFTIYEILEANRGYIYLYCVHSVVSNSL